MESLEKSTLLQEENGLYGLQVSKTGVMLATKNNEVYSDNELFAQVTPAGYFEFNNVRLTNGENNITVTSEDLSNNNSEFSQSLIINYEVNNVVDLVIQANDILLLPEIPKVDELVTVAVTVHNFGDIDSSASLLSVSAVDNNSNQHNN